MSLSITSLSIANFILDIEIDIENGCRSGRQESFELWSPYLRAYEDTKPLYRSREGRRQNKLLSDTSALGAGTMQTLRNLIV